MGLPWRVNAYEEAVLPEPFFLAVQALKEVYLPECGVWVSDYPFLNRIAFLDLSLEVERERQAHMAAL